MADGAGEQALVGHVQAQDVSGEGEALIEQDAQIDSSDEYDPSAHSFQDVSHAQPTSIATETNLVPPSLNPTSSTPSTPANATVPFASAPTTMIQTAAAAAEGEGQASPKGPPATAPPTADVETAIDTSSTPSNTRLPHDKIGILEDRIEADEKGDVQAWLELIDEYKRRGKLDDARKTYNRFFAIFPTAWDERVAQVQMENEAGSKKNVEDIFKVTLMGSASLKLWSTYMNHIRRYHNMTLDKSGKAAQVTYRAYQTVLDAVGQDKDSGPLWQDYIAYLKTTPGVIGGTNWQDSQKMDVLRTAYQQAIVIPHQATEALWKDYTNFETGINKQTGRKFLQDKSPEYMQARTSYNKLQNLTQGLSRTTLPRLPPAPGFDGHEEFMQQLAFWQGWISWELSDPLLIKDEDISKWKKRVVYAYKQALMAMRFWPEIWLGAAEFCFDNELDTEGSNFLKQGIEANSESALLAFREADRVELSTTNGNDDDSKAKRGEQVKAPYEKCLTALYALTAKVREAEVTQLKAIRASLTPTTNGTQVAGAPKSFEDDDENETKPNGDAGQTQQQQQAQARTAGVRAFHKAQVDQLQRTITHVWMAQMRALQRMQGAGNPNARIGGSRGVFAEARRKGQLTSDLFVAAAMLEYHNGNKEPAGKIFDRGAKLFPKDGAFALEHIKFLVSNNDTTNARVVFETSVSRFLGDEDETVKATARPLFVYFHNFESKYGELSQVMKLEARMRTSFPDDQRLGSFASRFIDTESVSAFNPTAVHPIISPTTQCRPRMQPFVNEPEPSPTVVPPAVSPRPAALSQPAVISSPKRPLPADLAELAQDRPSKMPREESPLKGAAGRRQAQANAGGTPLIGGMAALPSLGGPPPPAPLPKHISFLLSIIPAASTYNSTKFSPEGMVKLVQSLHVPSTFEEWKTIQGTKGQAQPSAPVNNGQPGLYWGQR